MSDLAATNCGCGEDRGGCGCNNNNGCGCDNGCNNGWGLSCGNNSCCNILWIIILLCLCGNNGCVAMDVAAAADNHYLPAEGNFPLPFSSVLESTSLLVESNFKLQLFMSRSVFYI